MKEQKRIWWIGGGVVLLLAALTVMLLKGGSSSGAPHSRAGNEKAAGSGSTSAARERAYGTVTRQVPTPARAPRCRQRFKAGAVATWLAAEVAAGLGVAVSAAAP